MVEDGAECGNSATVNIIVNCAVWRQARCLKSIIQYVLGSLPSLVLYSVHFMESYLEDGDASLMEYSSCTSCL